MQIGETPTDSLRITIQEGFLPHFRMSVEDSVLSLSMDEGIDLEGWTPASVRLAGVPVRRVDLSGGATCTSSRRMTEKKLTCVLSGGSVFEGEVDLGRLVAELTGGSTVTVSGRADIVSLGPVSGGSRVNAFMLQARLASVDASGGSRVNVSVKDSLFVQASGGSVIRYVGTPRIRQTLTGGSTVTGE